jgi:hypothetical protein
MFNIKKILSHALLALAMVAGSGAALAGPTFHITLDTANLGASNGYVDFTFLALGMATPATATMSNFAGFNPVAQSDTGDVNGTLPGTVVIGNTTGLNDVLALTDFGGQFSFDLNFNVADGALGSTFSVAFINEAFDSYLGMDGNVLDISVQPGVGGAATYALSPNNQFASITAVPEPTELLMMVTGLGLVGFVHRRRKERAAA